MRPIVSSDDLTDLLGHPDSPDGTVLIEVGTTMAGGDPAVAFGTERIAGACLLSLDDDLASDPGPHVGRHPLPSPVDFAAVLGRVGVGDRTSVVAYDRVIGGHAARLVWMLRVLGGHAALLDGGLTGWTGPTESGPPAAVEPVDRRPLEWPDHALADADDVARLIDDGGTVVDSRDAARYRGEVEPLDPVAGHIPGAINLPFAENLVAGADGSPTATFRSLDELDQRFLSVSAAADAGQLIVSCGSGVTACHNALALEAVGYRRPKVYVGSWSGWSSDPHRPVAVGDEA